MRPNKAHYDPIGRRLIVTRYARIGEAYKDALVRAVAHLIRLPGHSAAPAGDADETYEDALARAGSARLAARPGTRLQIPHERR